MTEQEADMIVAYIKKLSKDIKSFEDVRAGLTGLGAYVMGMYEGANQDDG